MNALFTKIATWTANQLGAPWAFTSSVILTIIWAACGPVFAYSDTWQLLINTFTTVLTFLAVFLIQNTQNRDSAALHLKLDELIRVTAARNAVMGVETKTEAEVTNMRNSMPSN